MVLVLGWLRETRAMCVYITYMIGVEKVYLVRTNNEYDAGFVASRRAAKLT